MPILYRLDEQGGFTVGDTDSRFASYAYPTSPHAEAAKKDPERVAAEMHKQAEDGAWMRAAGAPAADQVAQGNARMIAQLEAGMADGSTKELAAPEPSPSEIVQQAEARNDCTFDGWEVSHVIEFLNMEYQYQPNICQPWNEAAHGPLDTLRLEEDYVADFWTVYGHLPKGGVDAVADFPTEDEARDFLAAVTGDRHSDCCPRDPLDDLMRALRPDVAQLGEGVGGQVIDWPEQPDTYHGQRDQRAEEGRPIEPAARLLAALRTGWADQGATVTNHASQERGGLEPGDRVFLAPRDESRGR